MREGLVVLHSSAWSLPETHAALRKPIRSGRDSEIVGAERGIGLKHAAASWLRINPKLLVSLALKKHAARFLAAGLSIPDEVLVARDEGRVTFFCGAGVSRARARLADFFGLAEQYSRPLEANVCGGR